MLLCLRCVSIVVAVQAHQLCGVFFAEKLQKIDDLGAILGCSVQEK